eukprot:UN34658
MGFCHFNNVCVAARVALKENKSINKVLIMDWDVHHGNGTQEIFYKDKDVMYMSIHRYENGHFFPLGKAGGSSQAGKGAGEGYNVNLPLPCDGLGDYHYVEGFERLFLPIIKERKPDLILVSAGFDSARGDPLGEEDVTQNDR